MRVKKQINIEIGERVKTARERAELTQEQFAEKVDVSPQYVSDLERGVVGASLSTLKRSCVVLGCTSDELLFGTQQDRLFELNTLCHNLTEYQFSILKEVIIKFSEAIDSAKE